MANLILDNFPGKVEVWDSSDQPVPKVISIDDAEGTVWTVGHLPGHITGAVSIATAGAPGELLRVQYTVRDWSYLIDRLHWTLTDG